MEKRTLTELILFLGELNYNCDFQVNGEFLVCKDTHEKFTKDEIVIDYYFRLEGDSNPSDMSIIYGITAKSGTKGILIDAYGTYADEKVSEFFQGVEIRESG